jgi:dephospho-CoA kinase
MLKIGLTGGIGSGKSTVASCFSMLGIVIIDADEIVHELIQPSTPAFVSIVNHFGNNILAANNIINRKKLSRIIFANSKERFWLEQLLHPSVFEQLAIRAKLATSSYCILVIPLLFETNATHLVDRILVVASNKENCIKRLIKRSHMERCEIEAIMQTQISNEKRLALANDVIHNDGTIDNLKLQVKQLHEQYLRYYTK